MMSFIPLLVQLCLLVQLRSANSSSTESCSTVYLLHVVPLEHKSGKAWERGLEISPAGQLAAQQINDETQLLNGSLLEVIDIPSEPCESTSYDSFVEVLKLSTSQQKCVFGVIGLYCSSVTRTVAEPLNNPKFGYVQLSSATSPYLQNATIFPYLFRVVASNEIYGDTALEMMKQLNWTRVSVVYNFTDLTARRTGQIFAELVDNYFNFTTVAAIHLAGITTREINYVFSEFLKAATRVLFLSVSSKEAAIILCEAYKRKLRWPQYAYVVADETLEDILTYNGSCSFSEMRNAVNGTFILNKRMYVRNEIVLESGQTFQEYREEYRKALQRAEAKVGLPLKENEFANTLYDQVWAFAMAMNFTLNDIDTAINISNKLFIPKTMKNREALWRGLHNVSFQGASGMISFDSRQEVTTDIQVCQAKDGSITIIGEFVDRKLTFCDDFNTNSVPSDSYDYEVYTVPLALTAVIIVIQTLLLVLVLTSVIAMTYWRQKAEIKSTSVQIGYLMLIGAFLLCISPLLYTINDVLDIPLKVYSVICNVELWIFFLGVNIILVCLLFRLLRIVYVFRSYHSTGKYCSDTYLLLYIFLTSSVIMLILTVWVSVDPLHQISERESQPTANPPHFLSFKYCSSKWLGIWLGVSYTWISLLLVVVICLAIMTRKIKKENFKDTKKVNVFVFSIFVTCSIFLPLSRVLEPMHYILVSFILRNLSHITIILLSQVLLFLPKYIPLLLNRPTKTDQTKTIMKTIRTTRSWDNQ